MVFKEMFIREKLSAIDGHLDEVKHLFRFLPEEILKDSEKLHIAERLFQLIVDLMLDINQHFIKELKLKPSEDLQGTFTILGNSGVLPKEFALKIAPMVGLRNRLVHRYEELKPKLFVNEFYKKYSDFEKYIKLISEYLKSINT